MSLTIQLDYISNSMNIDKLKSLSQLYLDRCVDFYGLSKFQECSPYLEFERSIYERLSGEEGMEGEQNPDAEYDNITNSIVVYYPKVQSARHLAEIIIHEFQHYLQSPTWMARYYKMGYTYDNHPYEVAANKEESNWVTIVS
jgi:hypothetical protein